VLKFEGQNGQLQERKIEGLIKAVSKLKAHTCTNKSGICEMISVSALMGCLSGRQTIGASELPLLTSYE